ncbi:MAG TPA: sn-glycerol-3-phosphate ABC transporter substrate-binding protein UgpB [Xanthobacteraceae bacterium]
MRPKVSRRLALASAALAIVLLAVRPAFAATDIALWHAMPGELGYRIEKLAKDFNASQHDYRVVPTFKGLYTETMLAALFAMRVHQHPAIVQVAEVGTATMMAAKNAIVPVHELMREQHAAFAPADYLPVIAGYYSDTAGNMLSFPLNASTPILYYNKDQFRFAGLAADEPPKTWGQLEAAAERLRASGYACGFTTHYPSWVNVENFLALHGLPVATSANGMAGLDARLVIDNPLMARHLAALASWQKNGIFQYAGRTTRGEQAFIAHACGIFLGSSASRADFLAQANFEIGYGMLPYYPDVAGAPRNSIIGGGSLWALRERPEAEYKGVAAFFAFLSRPEVQAQWHQTTGYLPITRAAYELTRSQGFYDKNPGADIAIKQITLNPPTADTKGLRLGSYVTVRDIIEEEMEHALDGKKTAQAALESAVERGNAVLREFERSNK